jgi:hypothetical protein
MADDLTGALREAEATAKGTRCKQYLFSLSLNPPQKETARVEDFEMALNTIEQRLGLSGQPRVIVFHEKEGRRHAHAVWSRIDTEKMTAIPLPFFKTKLREVSKELYLEHGWKLPRGLIDSKARDPRNFTLEEWQQAKRIGRDAAELKGIIIECWASSDSAAAFAKALGERGMYLAKGDRRAHVAVTFEGETLQSPERSARRPKRSPPASARRTICKASMKPVSASPPISSRCSNPMSIRPALVTQRTWSRWKRSAKKCGSAMPKSAAGWMMASVRGRTKKPESVHRGCAAASWDCGTGSTAHMPAPSSKMKSRR